MILSNYLRSRIRLKNNIPDYRRLQSILVISFVLECMMLSYLNNLEWIIHKQSVWLYFNRKTDKQETSSLIAGKFTLPMFAVCHVAPKILLDTKQKPSATIISDHVFIMIIYDYWWCYYHHNYRLWINFSQMDSE